MSVRNWIASLLAISSLLFLAACGSNGSIANSVAPPSGGFSASNLNGTYIFSVSGTDSTGAPYAIVGNFTANGKGGISGGAFDLTDANTAELSAPAANQGISASSSYKVGVDGRGQANLVTTLSGFGTITLDFVLSSSSQGQVTEFDTFGSGSGTLDLQAAGTTPSGSYAFSLSGASGSSVWATAGNFTLSGSSLSGFADLNEAGLLVYADSTLSGSLAVGPSSTPATNLTLVFSGNTVLNGTFDVFSIDATHLKFIEMDGIATLSGDAYSQTSSTLPTGTLAFTLEGATSASEPLAAGGFMVTNGSGGISGTEDYNVGGSNISTSPAAFTATYAVDPNDSGRYILTIPAGTFVEGTSYSAYPSSGGTLLLELDNAGVTAGAAYTQSATTFAATSQGYGLNLTGVYSSSQGTTEVDDIAEFTANPSGTTVAGAIDENYAGATSLFYDQILKGTFGSIDSNGRYGISAATGTSSSPGTLEGGLNLTLYSADGINFPFVELDAGQVSAGLIVQQDASSSPSAVARPHLFVPRPLIPAHGFHRNKN